MKFLLVIFVIANLSICKSLDSTTEFIEEVTTEIPETTTDVPQEETTIIPDNRVIFHGPFHHKPHKKPFFHHNNPEEWPSCTVNIYNYGQLICSGFLWSQWYIVTTADCIEKVYDSNGLYIIVDGTKKTMHRISVAKYHRNFQADHEGYNIAILKTCLPVLKPKRNCVIAVSTETYYCDNLPKTLHTESFSRGNDLKFELIPKGNQSVCISQTLNSCCLKQTGSLSTCGWERGAPLFSSETNVHGLIASNPEINCNKDLVKIMGFREEHLHWIGHFAKSFKVVKCKKVFKGSTIEPF